MNVFVVAKKLIKEIGNDPRTIAMLFIAPLFIISLLYIVLNNGIEKVYIGIPQELEMEIEGDNIVSYTLSQSEMEASLENGEIDGYISVEDGKLIVTLEGTNPTISGKVLQNIQTAMSTGLVEKLETLKLPIQLPEISVGFVYGNENMTSFDHIAPFMMGYVVFFLVFLLSGIAFLRERISGTMTRMMATAVKRSEIVLGYILGFGFFAFMQTIVIQLYMTFVLKIHNEGNFLVILVINLFVAGGSLTFGLLLSAFARNEFQLFQFIPIVIIPQTLFAGLFPLRETPDFIQGLSTIFPLAYAGEALREVMLRGKGFEAVWDELIVLFGFLILFLLLNIQALKKYRHS